MKNCITLFDNSINVVLVNQKKKKKIICNFDEVV